jgi:hypothetical protein
MPSKKAMKLKDSQAVKTMGSRMAQPVANLRENQLCSTDMNAFFCFFVVVCARSGAREERGRVWVRGVGVGSVVCVCVLMAVSVVVRCM